MVFSMGPDPSDCWASLRRTRGIGLWICGLGLFKSSTKKPNVVLRCFSSDESSFSSEDGIDRTISLSLLERRINQPEAMVERAGWFLPCAREKEKLEQHGA